MHLPFGERTNPVKKVTISFFVLLVMAFVVVIGSIITASMLTSSDDAIQYRQHIAQLQYEKRHLISKVSETEALLALRDGQIEGMQQELLRNSHNMLEMKQRLSMFEDVLAARKVGGWHILHPTAEWLDDQTIAYHLVVVKGENYPRWAKGHLSFSVVAPNGDVVALQNRRGKRSLKFDMTTHSFFDGVIPWTKAWQAKVLVVSLFDKRGKNNQKIEIPILSRHSLKQIKSDLSEPVFSKAMRKQSHDSEATAEEIAPKQGVMND